MESAASVSEQGGQASDENSEEESSAKEAGDVLGDQYCKLYLDDQIIPKADSMTTAISKSMRELIDDAAWLTIDGATFLKGKP